MKRITLVSLVIILTLSTCIITSANQEAGNVYEIGDKMIIFDATSTFSIEEQQYIAEIIANPETQVSTYGLMCTLFGHKNTSETVIAITHCVNVDDPRCMQENFIVTSCSRCDETTTERVSYSFISCCPED